MGAQQTLRDYQEASLEAVADALAQGFNRVLVKQPTGTGKTTVFSSMPTWPRIQEFIEAHHGPIGGQAQVGTGPFMLVIAHREELLDQAAERIHQQNPDLYVEVEQGDRRASAYCDVVVASIQTLAALKFRRLRALLARSTFRIVIIDEAHHAAAPSYRTGLVHLGFLPAAEGTDTEGIEAIEFDDTTVMEQALAEWDKTAPKDRLLVGVTATPNRTDAIGLGCVFQTIAYSYALKTAIEDKHLVPIEPWVIESDVSLDRVRTTAGDFNLKDLAAAVNQERRNELAVASWLEHAKGGQTLAFTVDVAHAIAMADTFTKAGVRAAYVSGETPKDERRALLEKFRRQQLDVLCNCMVLTEGTDLPMARVILHAKPTKSATLYEQMTGRGLRLFPGKDRCIVIDIVDIARKHSLQTAPVLYGLPPGLEPEEHMTLDELERQLAALAEQYPGFDIEAALREGRLTLAELRKRASTFDIWTVQSLAPELAAIARMNWLTLSRGYTLQYPWELGTGAEKLEGNETLEVAKDLIGKWAIALTWKQKRPKDAPRDWQGEVRQRTLGTGFTDAAAGLQAAELFLARDRRRATSMTDRDAPWRSKPASKGQTDYLTKLRVPFKPGVTSGEASDLINLAKAQRGGGGGPRQYPRR